MKIVKIAYHCDYCKKTIDTDSDTVCILHPGRIGYQDSIVYDSDDSIRHYHDYCMEHILALTYQEEYSEKEEEPVPDLEADQLKETKEKTGINRKKDLGKLQSLLNAGWTVKEIREEFNVSDQTVRNWMKELKGGQK